MTGAHRRAARARMALAACALWLVGVEGLPAVHQAMHSRLAPHHHDLGTIVTVSFEDTTHRHPDGSIHVVEPDPSRTDPADHAHATDGTDRPHATSGTDHAGGLAHHAAALAPVPPPITQPLPVDRRPSFVVIERTIELVAREPLAATARGPPSNS